MKQETLDVKGPLNLIIAGVGGQGSIFASQIIARAAMEEGFSVRTAETYGVPSGAGQCTARCGSAGRSMDLLYGKEGATSSWAWSPSRHCAGQPNTWLQGGA